MEPHQERVYHYFKAAYKRKYHEKEDDFEHDFGSDAIPPNAELWINRDCFYLWGE